MTFDDDDWGRPVETGEFARPENLNGHLLVVFPLGYVPHIQTKFTVPGKKSDAICCDIIDLDDKDDSGQPGKVYRQSNLMQGQLIATLKPWIGRKVLGRMGKGVSKNGMNAPWVITDMLDDQACVDRARAWSQSHPNFQKSPFQEWKEEPVSAATQATINQVLPPSLRSDAQPERGYSQYDTYNPPAQQQTAPVQGSVTLSAEEQSVLARLRERQAAAARQQQGEDPPF
jgi:hypothetical protein